MPLFLPTDAHFALAAAQLRAGGLVAFPTETVYGLGANALDSTAIARVYEAKGRPSYNPLIVHCLTVAQAQLYGKWTEDAEILAQAFWPGPLTLVLERTAGCALSPEVSAGGTTVALRIPAHPIARRLLQEAAVPIAAPSANRSGRISPTSAFHVAASLGEKVDMILDGGACPVGIESTVVDASLSPPQLLRPGTITVSMLEDALHTSLHAPALKGELRSPGLLASHYAPSLPLLMNVSHPQEGHALLAFGKTVPPHKGTMLNLSASGDVEEAARHLFDYLHRLDTPEHSAIAVMPIPEKGIGIAINDRLRRAAAPRG